MMNNTVQHKLLELEILPPPQVWNWVEEKLNTAPVMDLTAKLRESMVVPPAAVWNQIERKLSSPAVLKRRWIRYAAASVMTGLLFSAAYFLSFSSNKKLATAKKEKISSPVVITKKSSNSNDLPFIDPEQINDRALEQSKRTYADVNVDRKKISRIASGFNVSSAEEIINTNHPITENINKRYIVLMTPDGNFIRLSKKMGNLVCCLSGEEDDRSCKELVGKWQKQLASAELLQAGNFSDILSMVTELQQNK